MNRTVKKVIDVVFKADKKILWEGMTKLLVFDEAQREFTNLHRAFNDVNSQLETNFSQVAAKLKCLQQANFSKELDFVVAHLECSSTK